MIDTNVFVGGLVAHVIAEAGGEAGRFSTLCEGAALAMNYCNRVGVMPAETTLEMVKPDALKLDENNALVQLFYEIADEEF